MLEHQVWPFYNTVDGSQPIAIFNSLDKSVEFLGGLDIPNFYNKAEVRNWIANLNLVNYYTKDQVDALIPDINLVDYYTKAEVDTQLPYYATVTYLQDNYMTTLAVTETLMNKYASISLLGGNFYDKTYLDNQFSLKSDVSELASLVTAEYLITKYTNSVDLPTDYYNKTETDNMLLSYSTGSYVDYSFYTKTETDTLLAGKLINIGGIPLPGMLDIGASGYTNSRIRCNADIGGYTGYAEMRAANSYDMFLNLSTTRADGGWMYFKINNDDYMQLLSSDNKVNIYKDTTARGNLDVCKVVKLHRHPTESDTIPLVITNTSSSGSGFIVKFVSTVKGCLFEYLTGASSTSWWQGVLSGSNEIAIKTGSNGLTIKSNGSAAISGHLDVGKDDVVHNTTVEQIIQILNGYQGYAGYGRIYQWRDYVLIFNIVTNRSAARMLFWLEEVTFMYLSGVSNNMQFF